MIRRYIQRVVVDCFKYLLSKVGVKNRPVFYFAWQENELACDFQEVLEDRVAKAISRQGMDINFMIRDKVNEIVSSADFMDDLVNRINLKQLKR